MKTIASRTHQAVALLKQEAIWLLTATPMWNRPLDFGGYLSLFEANLASPEGLANSTDPDIDPSSTASTFASYTQWSAKNPLPTTGLPYHLLSVVQFTSLGQGGHLTTEMGFNTLPICIYADNNGAIALASNPEFHANTKHITIRFHRLREEVAASIVKFVKIPTAEMAADRLTKPLGKVMFKRFVNQLGLMLYKIH